MLPADSFGGSSTLFGTMPCSFSSRACLPHLTAFLPTVPLLASPQVFIERAAKAVRRMRLEREKKAAEERAERLAAGRTPGGRWAWPRLPALQRAGPPGRLVLVAPESPQPC